MAKRASTAAPRGRTTASRVSKAAPAPERSTGRSRPSPTAPRRGEPLDTEVAKAFVIGPAPGVAEHAQSNRLQPLDEEMRRLTRAGAIASPYPPQDLCMRVEESTALTPAIAAMIANVHAHSHRFEPVIDLKGDGTRDLFRKAMIIERMRAGANWQHIVSYSPTDFEIDQRIAAVQLRMDLEQMRLDALFSACVPGSSFDLLRQQLAYDFEATGYMCMGALRDDGGDLVQFEYLPSATMRLRPVIQDKHGHPRWIRVATAVRRTPISIERIPVPRLFRTYVQFGFGKEVYFKDFGCPLTVSARDGRVYDSIDELPSGHTPATEVAYLALHNPLSVYGVPRWIASVPVMHGLRGAQEVNANHFDANCIPRMMILVNGGTLRSGADKKIENHLRQQVKGRENYGNIVVIEAVPAQGLTGPNARVAIEIKSLRDAVPDDGLFQKYEANAAATVWSQFRIPKFLLGLAEDVNRATSDAILDFTNGQVFNPERNRFDTFVSLILANEDILFWKFVSNSPVSRDPKDVATIAKMFGDMGSATLNDGRMMMAEAFNKPFPKIEQPWGDLPMFMAQAGVAQPQATSSSLITGKAAPTTKGNGAPQPVMMRATSPAELADWLKHAASALRAGEPGRPIEIQTSQGLTLVLPMTGEQVASWVEPAAA